MKKKFTFTIGAIKEVCERCPDHDIARIQELFNENDLVTMLDNMAWFISVLDRWTVKKETGTEEGALTIDDILLMDMEEINALFADAMAAFNKDSKSESEIEPVKKTKAVSKSKK